MMKKQAICIQCHNKPEQVNYLIEHLPKEEFDIFIHVDKKSNIIDDISKKSNVFFCKKRVNVQWARFSQVEATLELFKMVDEKKYKYIHLISGQDYMIKPSEYFTKLFTEENECEYIQSNTLPDYNMWSTQWGGRSRYEVWYPQWLIKRPKKVFIRLLKSAYVALVMHMNCLKRKKYPVEQFYGGSSWFSITAKSMGWIKAYLSSHPSYIKFFRHTIYADELFFSTLIRISPYKNNIVNNPLRFMIWKGSNTGGPKELEIKNIDEMKQSDAIFARKVTDMSVIQQMQNQLCE